MAKDTFSGGATRNKLPYRYDLMELSILQEYAQALAEGAELHGEENWRKGLHDPEFIKATRNHMWNHFILWMQGDRSEPHMGKVLFGFKVCHEAEKLAGEKSVQIAGRVFPVTPPPVR